MEPPNEFPVLLSHVWSAFINLNRSRSSGFSGPNPITYEQILAWKELTGTPIEPYEVDIITKLDRIYLDTLSSE